MSEDLKQRVNEVFGVSFCGYRDTKTLQLHLEMALDLLKDVYTEFTEREAKLAKALREIENSEECHELWYRVIAHDVLVELNLLGE